MTNHLSILMAIHSPVQMKIQRFRDSLQPVRKVLEKQGFMGGQRPNYSDFILVSEFLTSKATSTFQVSSP